MSIGFAGGLSLGLDFGTESVRALVVDVQSGQECGEGIALYQHGVMDRELICDHQRSAALPASDDAASRPKDHDDKSFAPNPSTLAKPVLKINLPENFALQNAFDYLESMTNAVHLALKNMAEHFPLRSPSEICGVGIAFTASSPLPIKNGQPLSQYFPQEPHAYVKLWKHHAAQAQADFINHNAPWDLLNRYGSAVSCEWSLPKLLEVTEKAPWLLESADHWIEAGDWVVSTLVNKGTRPVRSRCQAGYKGLWSEDNGYPSPSFLKTCSPLLAKNFETLMAGTPLPLGSSAGNLSAEWALRWGIPTYNKEIPVAVAAIDAHAGVIGSGVCKHGEMLCVLGTSTCHMALSRSLRYIPGIAGAVKDGIAPGLIGYEAGQPAVGDLFAWFLKLQNKPVNAEEFQNPEEAAHFVPPGANGVTALDWWNGNRSVLMDGHVKGTIIGMRLTTTPADIYRALLESTAFGTKIILDTMKQGAISFNRIVLSGGLAAKSELLCQIYADVLNTPLEVVVARQPVALGAAIYGGCVAAKITTTKDFESLVGKMTTQIQIRKYTPQNAKAYEQPFRRYLKLQPLMQKFYHNDYND